MENFFKTEKVTDRITRIIGVTGEMMYLAVGDDRAALIDTGVGACSLRPLIEQMTSKPLIVILTHGHVDHAFGAAEFEEVYMNSEDELTVKYCANMEDRIQYCSRSSFEAIKNQPAENYLPTPTEFRELLDGDLFELGGLTLEIYKLPGHTRGSMTVLFKEERLLLTGDACNPATFLFFYGCPSLEEYRDNLAEYRERVAGKYDGILLSHSSEILDSQLIDTVLETCNCVFDGTADNVPMGGPEEAQACCAFEVVFEKDRVRRKDGKVGNVMYSKRNIYKDK